MQLHGALQEMNGAVDEAEVRRAAQLFSDLSRVVSAKQLGPMLRTQVLRTQGSGSQEELRNEMHSARTSHCLCPAHTTPELLLQGGSGQQRHAGSLLTAWPFPVRQAMRSAYGDAPEAGSSGVRLLLDTNVVMLKENPYAAMVSDRYCSHCAHDRSPASNAVCTFTPRSGSGSKQRFLRCYKHHNTVQLVPVGPNA
jgi:hypothetical protein